MEFKLKLCFQNDLIRFIGDQLDKISKLIFSLYEVFHTYCNFIFYKGRSFVEENPIFSNYLE